MIQIELPCCEATVVLDPEAATVHCDACVIEHLLAPDARPAPVDRQARTDEQVRAALHAVAA